MPPKKNTKRGGSLASSSVVKAVDAGAWSKIEATNQVPMTMSGGAQSFMDLVTGRSGGKKARAGYTIHHQTVGGAVASAPIPKLTVPTGTAPVRTGEIMQGSLLNTDTTVAPMDYMAKFPDSIGSRTSFQLGGKVSHKKKAVVTKKKPSPTKKPTATAPKKKPAAKKKDDLAEGLKKLQRDLRNLFRVK
jgi:hypothetical protein